MRTNQAAGFWPPPEPVKKHNHRFQSGQHPHGERGLDFYQTPAVAVKALLRHERLPNGIWEPAAGKGAIAQVLRAAGHTVCTSDVHDYGGLNFVRNFVTETKMPRGTEAIVTNPPYKFANRFVAKALELAPKVVMLLPLTFLESEGRRKILEDCGLARIYVFRNRVPMMHREGWTGKKASPAKAFCWCVWDVRHSGDPKLKWISWERDVPSFKAALARD